MKTYISIAAKLLVVIAFMQAKPSLAKVVLDQEDLPISSLCQESENGNAYFLEDPEDCSKYYMCQPTLDPVEPWIAINMTCPGNLQFDTNLNVCNYAQVVGCVDKDTKTFYGAYGSYGAAKSFEAEEESSTENPISELCQEPSEDGLAYFLADPDNCSEYYVCQLNVVDFEYQWIAIHMSCPGNLQFDTNFNVCNYAEVVGCVDN
jgi:hypothetical protein